jgi:hypothetical protein
MEKSSYEEWKAALISRLNTLNEEGDEYTNWHLCVLLADSILHSSGVIEKSNFDSWSLEEILSKLNILQ